MVDKCSRCSGETREGRPARFCYHCADEMIQEATKGTITLAEALKRAKGCVIVTINNLTGKEINLIQTAFQEVEKNLEVAFGETNKCERLDRELTVYEQVMFEKALKEFKENGKCVHHLVLRLYGQESGPYHGCVVCGEPIA